jgi:hypothetical protein
MQDENKDISPDLIDYIYFYCGSFQTKEEMLAGKSILYNTKGLSPKTLDFIKSKGWFSDEERIQAMIADGFEALKERVAIRIYQQHKDELNLNYCPKCNKLARTPQAKQCRFCFFDWH